MPTIPRGLIGVIHLPALPGDPRYEGDGQPGPILDFALRDARALVEGGAAGIILENFGSLPFAKGDASARLEPYPVALMARIAALLREAFPTLSLGVNCLRNDAISALAIATACQLDFLRINVHTGAYLTDQGVIEGEAHLTLRERRRLLSEVKILADVHVKHAQPLVPIDIELAVEDCLLRGLADAVIVTGAGTGKPVSAELLGRVRRAAHGAPVLIGSGLSPQNAAQLAPLADAAIVGTWLKQDGILHNPVDPQRVTTLAGLLDRLLAA